MAFSAANGDGERDWQRLAKYVISARIQRGWYTRGQFRKHSKLSERFLFDIEHARRSNYEPPYLARLEQALGWETGSVDQILAGGGPILPGERATVTAAPGPDPAVDVADLELEVGTILAVDLPDDIKRQVLEEALQFRTEEARAAQRFREDRAAARSRLVSRWQKRVGAESEPA